MSTNAQQAQPSAQEQFERAVPSVNIGTRARLVARQQVLEWALSVASRVPGLRGRTDRPRTQPLRSGSVRLLGWYRGRYGTDAKPASLEKIPWDYIEANRDSIPFTGLREYWYPVLESRKLRNNTPLPMTVCGDDVVFFRDAEGKAVALANRCPHRSALLSLGQVGITEPGTITCRYHGMTFDGSGACTAYLADGPGSPAVGKIHARSYPVEEHGGLAWIYMGDKKPESVLDSVPHARSVFAQRSLIVRPVQLPYSHLNMLDNATDLTHVGCLHRTCVLFGDQKPFGEIDAEEVPGGVRAWYKQPGEHPGVMHIDSIEWYLPNLVYHAPGDLGGGLGEGWFWFTPRDEAGFTGWLIIGVDVKGGAAARALFGAATRLLSGSLFSERFGLGTLAACLTAGDAPMQASQGRVVRWDTERLARGDRSVTKARQVIQRAHRAEVAERRAAFDAGGLRDEPGARSQRGVRSSARQPNRRS
ncbi:Rieske 2Fe-2S domain-containing protein [Amycolatopsis sp. NPDC004378]